MKMQKQNWQTWTVTENTVTSRVLNGQTETKSSFTLKVVPAGENSHEELKAAQALAVIFIQCFWLDEEDKREIAREAAERFGHSLHNPELSFEASEPSLSTTFNNRFALNRLGKAWGLWRKTMEDDGNVSVEEQEETDSSLN